MFQRVLFDMRDSDSDSETDSVQQPYLKAISVLRKLSYLKSPRDKLGCILLTFKVKKKDGLKKRIIFTETLLNTKLNSSITHLHHFSRAVFVPYLLTVIFSGDDSMCRRFLGNPRTRSRCVPHCSLLFLRYFIYMVS